MVFIGIWYLFIFCGLIILYNIYDVVVGWGVGYLGKGGVLFGVWGGVCKGLGGIKRRFN